MNVHENFIGPISNECDQKNKENFLNICGNGVLSYSGRNKVISKASLLFFKFSSNFVFMFVPVLRIKNR